jgi:SAM-dependent methyltransferase
VHHPDPGRYGRSFADVYDEWYPGGDEHEVVAHLRRLLAPGARVLELGVGTGRVALLLARAGFEVHGLDASREMLGLLAAKDPGGSVATHLGDAADAADWPAGPFDAVLAACNLLLNLPSAAAQEACVRAAAGRLRPGGLLVVELSLLDGDAPARGLEVRSVGPDAVHLIATETDPATGVVQGAHVELRDGEAVRLRPWSIRPLAVGELDAWCATLGLEPAGRHADWRGGAPAGDDAHLVATWRRPG